MAFNLLLWGGAKQYLGFNKHFNGNLYVYPDANMPTATHALGAGTGFSPYCYLGAGTSAFPPSMRDSWVNETCVAAAPSALYSSGCTPSKPDDGNLPLLANNTLLLDAGNYSLACGSETWDLAEAQAHGVDVGTVAGAAPDTQALLALMAQFVAGNLLPPL